jgi:cell division transport system permease protein
MLSRISYTFREMWASLRRNLTLTVAAIVTASVSLLLFGLTLLIQRGFDNQLSQWSGGVELIVYMQNDASELQIQTVRDALESTPNVVDASRLQYLDLDASFAEAQRLFAGDPATLQLLTPENMPTQFKVVPTDEASTELLDQLSAGFRGLPGVQSVVFPARRSTC